MAINENWNIRGRSHVCAHTERPFAEGDTFYTALFEEGPEKELVRRDYSADAWKELEGTLTPFSFWKSTYDPPKTEGRVEVVEKESAEALLRRLVEEDSITTENTRYILAVMLERKKQLRQTGTRETEDATFLVYEHPKSGEVYIIRDPELKLDQLETVQTEVSRLLEQGAAPPPEPAPPTAETPATDAPAPEEPAEPQPTATP